MKKLMTVAAAALCATAFGAIESTNIVGYQTKALNVSGTSTSVFTFVAPTFLTVGGETSLKLGDFKLNYAGDDFSTQSVGLLDRGGAVEAEYYYVNSAIAAGIDGIDAGWYVATSTGGLGASADTVSVPYGQGFVLWNADENTKIVFTGAVNTEDANVTCEQGIFTFTGNCQPKEYTLADVALVYAGNDATNKRIWTLKPNGGTDKEYYYVSETAAAFEDVAVGWYTDTTFATPANDVILKPGDGIAVNSGAAGTKFRVPKAL